jgi:hypothetical protein
MLYLNAASICAKFLLVFYFEKILYFAKYF